MKFLNISMALALLAGSAAVAQAGTATGATCATGSFASYASPGFSCSMGILQFFNFELSAVDPGQTPTGTGLLNAITIEPDWNASTGVASLRMSGFWGLGVDAGNTAAWRIRYTVDPPPVLGGETMELDGSDPFADFMSVVTGSQSYCMEGTFGVTSGMCESQVGGGTTTFSLGSPASLVFANPLVTLDTITTIRVNPNLDTASQFNAVTFSIQTVSAVPEPGGWLLAATGLLAIVRLRRRSS